MKLIIYLLVVCTLLIICLPFTRQDLRSTVDSPKSAVWSVVLLSILWPIEFIVLCLVAVPILVLTLWALVSGPQEKDYDSGR